jgi:small basic protein (TIGR04137 family)
MRLDLLLQHTEARLATMSIDKTLRSGGRLSRSRNVLKRDERIAKLKEDDRWSDSQGPLGLPKVRVQKTAVGKKKKKKEEGEEGTAAAGAAKT